MQGGDLELCSKRRPKWIHLRKTQIYIRYIRPSRAQDRSRAAGVVLKFLVAVGLRKHRAGWRRQSTERRWRLLPPFFFSSSLVSDPEKAEGSEAATCT